MKHLFIIGYLGYFQFLVVVGNVKLLSVIVDNVTNIFEQNYF